MKCFRQASEYIEVDQDVLDKAKTWLNNQLSSSTPGKFNEPGKVIHTEMQVQHSCTILFLLLSVSHFTLC